MIGQRSSKKRTKAMKLTKNEKTICKKYSSRDEEGLVHCNKCPLLVTSTEANGLDSCYAIIDGRTKQARELKRL